jgi:hypothetical protein
MCCLLLQIQRKCNNNIGNYFNINDIASPENCTIKFSKNMGRLSRKLKELMLITYSNCLVVS